MPTGGVSKYKKEEGISATPYKGRSQQKDTGKTPEMRQVEKGKASPVAGLNQHDKGASPEYCCQKETGSVPYDRVGQPSARGGLSYHITGKPNNTTLLGGGHRARPLAGFTLVEEVKMGITHFDKVCGVSGIYVGADVQVVNESGEWVAPGSPASGYSGVSGVSGYSGASGISGLNGSPTGSTVTFTSGYSGNVPMTDKTWTIVNGLVTIS
jgi:hypothetical protein